MANKVKIQGDVPIIFIDAIPDGGKVSKNRIVAYGEATGHNHQVVGDAVCYEYPDRWVFSIGENGAELVHTSSGEHAPVTLYPNTFVMIPRGVQQREYAGEYERRVLD